MPWFSAIETQTKALNWSVSILGLTPLHLETSRRRMGDGAGNCIVPSISMPLTSRVSNCFKALRFSTHDEGPISMDHDRRISVCTFGIVGTRQPMSIKPIGMSLPRPEFITNTLSMGMCTCQRSSATRFGGVCTLWNSARSTFWPILSN